MSTYLELFQSAKRNCRLTGTAPTTVTGNLGVLDRLSHWVADAYTELQNRHNWRWLRHEFTLPLVASTSQYEYTDCTDSETAATIARFKRWWLNDTEDPPKAYLTATGVSGEYWLSYTPWESFKSVYLRNFTSESNPAVCSVDHLNRINVGPTPDDAYTLTSDYQLSPQVLSLNADVPEMPSQYHMLIVYLAMQKYGLIEGAPEVLAMGQSEGNRMLRQLEIDQLQRMRLAVPMA